MFLTSHEVSSLDQFEFALINHFVKFVFVSVGIAILPVDFSHSSHEDSTRIQSGVSIVNGIFGHVATQKDATRCDTVEVFLDFLLEHLNTTPEE